jgi:hypothetical protein
MDENQNLEMARQQAADLEKQLADLRAQGGNPNEEARIQQELAQVYQVIGNAGPAGPQPGSPYNPHAYAPPLPGRYQESRATTILVFGILSIVVCQLFGPFAWSMGNTELRKIDQGLIDPSDRGSIQAGRICGIIGSALIVVWVLAVMSMMMFAASAANHY